MKYMLLFVDLVDWGQVPEAESRAMFEKVGRWWGEHSQARRIESGAQLQPARTASTVKFNHGKPVVTDGPFLEAKETIGGFAIVNVPDLDSALALAKSWPAQGKVEVRPLVEQEARV